MNRMWEIREGYEGGRKYGMRKNEDAEEAYECGYEDGYRAAMEKQGYRRY